MARSEGHMSQLPLSLLGLLTVTLEEFNDDRDEEKG